MRKEGKVLMSLLKKRTITPQGVGADRAHGRYSLAFVSRLGPLSLDLLPESLVIHLGDVADSAICSVGAVVAKVDPARSSSRPARWTLAVWRLTSLLMRIKKGMTEQKDVKNAERTPQLIA